MARLREIDDAHNRVTEWAEWFIRCIESSAIGYPSTTAEARFKEYAAVISGRPAGSICPEVMMARRVAEVDAAVRSMPSDMKWLIRLKYTTSALDSEKLYAYTRRTGKPASDYDKAVNAALEFIINHRRGSRRDG